MSSNRVLSLLYHSKVARHTSRTIVHYRPSPNRTTELPALNVAWSQLDIPLESEGHQLQPVSKLSLNQVTTARIKVTTSGLEIVGHPAGV